MIGRAIAMQPSGFVESSGTTCNGVDRMNSTTCNVDAGYDHTYRIFLRSGEKITISETSGPCFLGSSHARLKVYQSPTACGDPAVGSCVDSSKLVSCVTGTKQVIAAAEGWHVIVVDGDTPSDGIEYSLTVKLDPASCVGVGCECP